MLSQTRVFALPAGLLALLAHLPCPIHGHELRWPYNLPSHAKYYPEEEIFVKRDESIQKKLQRQPVMGVKKMSDDEGEKFYLDYWAFAPLSSDGDVESVELGQQKEEDEGELFMVNNTMLGQARPPLLLHSTHNSIVAHNALSRYIRFPLSPRSELDRRDFQCPSGTSSCESINRPDSCCAEGQTCQSIQDTGLGDVGCCAAGDTCAGSLSNCASDYTSCPNYPGGGCCIPGYACVNGGCLLSSTATLIVTPTPSRTRSSLSTSDSTTTTVVSSSPSPSTVVVASPPTTSAVPASPSAQSPTITTTTIDSTSSITNTLGCSSGFRSCPASLGGGCCPTDRACGRDVCPELTSTATVGAPVRPTSVVPTTTSDASVTGCPTGFYACSALYQGGCCRLGRDCAPTSCPTSATTALIDNDSVTVIVTTSSGLTANSILTGACATGWSSCAASDGGGCCPTGYQCGSSCTTTAEVSGLQASEIGKLAPNGGVCGSARGVLVFGICTSVMVLIFLAV
jgi:progranulin